MGPARHPVLPDGVVVRTLAFSDLVDSTTIVRELGDARAAELFAAADRTTRDLLVAHAGVEIDKSDGFFAMFERPWAAVAWAMGLHRGLRDVSAAHGATLAARVGIHLGEVHVRRNAPEDVARGAKPIEIEGLAKPLGARVMSLARGGQTLLTRSAFDLASRVAEGAVPLAWASHGRFDLQGLSEAVEVCEVGETLVGRPPDNAKVRSAEPVSRTNLRPGDGRFFGRQRDLEVLARIVEDGASPITVLGPGGTGKTRLVTELGLAFAADRPGGVWMCDLVEARTRADVIRAVATPLGVPLAAEQSDDAAADRVGRALAGRDRPILIVDNFEQLVAHAEATVGRWRRAAPGATLLVTSRERLRLAHEQVLELEPLGLDEAAALFEDRARRVRPDWTPTDDERATVRDLVERLDRMPLAIELAAARMRTHGPATLLARMDQRFQLLRGQRQGRQATMRAAIDGSWELLDQVERAALSQLSVFRGGFSLADAEAVLDLGPGAGLPEDVVDSLRDKSLLRAWVPEALPGELRLGMYDTIRVYAAERLVESGGGAVAELRHAQHHARLGSVVSRSADPGLGMRRAHVDLENLIAAVRRTASVAPEVALECLLLASWVISHVGPRTLAIDLFAELEPHAARLAPASHVKFLVESVRHARTGSDFGRAIETLGRARDLAIEIGDAALERHVRFVRLENVDLHVRPAEVETVLREVLAEVSGDKASPESPWHLALLGTALRMQDRLDEAVDALRRSLAIARIRESLWDVASSCKSLAVLLVDRGDLEEAERLYEEAARISRDLVGLGRTHWIHGALATLRMDQGRLDDADALYTAAITGYRAMGLDLEEAVELGNVGVLRHLQGRHDEARDAFDLATGRLVSPHLAWPRGYFHAHAGALAADMGRLGDARRQLQMARQDHAAVGDAALAALIDVCEGHLDLAEGRVSEARARLESRQGESARSVDLRIAARRLDARTAPPEHAEPPAADESP